MYFKNHLLAIGLTFNLILLYAIPLIGQDAQKDYNQEYNNSYYEQKVSLFNLLPQSENDIIFLGNSITDIGEWAEMWQNIEVKNRGISSDITAGVLARLDQIIKGKPAKLFIMIGINDIARNIPDTILFNNYVKIINKVITRSPDTKVYVQSILPTNNSFPDYKNHQNKKEIIDIVNANLSALCKRLNITFIDMDAHFSDESGRLKKEYTNDGLHLNGAGYMKWKEVLQENNYCCD